MLIIIYILLNSSLYLLKWLIQIIDLTSVEIKLVYLFGLLLNYGNNLKKTEC